MVFCQLVHFKCHSAELADELIRNVTALTIFSNVHESGTLTYEVHRKQGDDLSLMILERFENEAALDVHRQSQEYKTFVQWLNANKERVCVISKDVIAETTESLGARTLQLPTKQGCLVFCGSRSGTDPAYEQQAQELGAELARRKTHLVYGGGTAGIMGAVAKAALANGGQAFGIRPRALSAKEGDATGKEICPMIYTHTMAERKKLMFAMSETVIALPGGIGTYEELLEAMTSFQLNIKRFKIGLLNTNNFYEPFLAWIKHMIAAGFVGEECWGYLVIAATPIELLAKMEAFVPPPASAALHWPTHTV